MVNLKKNQEYYLKRAQIIGILCIVVALVILIINLIQKVKWYEYIVVITLFVAGIVFIFISNKIRIKAQNKNKIRK